MSQRIYCTISGHGFGHLAQMTALLNQLAKRLPDMQLRIVGAVPHDVVARLLQHVDFSMEYRALDVGLVQTDPMQVDLQANTRALRALHDNWEKHLEAEKRALADWKPDLLLANVPYLPFAAAADLGVPAVAAASLTWDAVLAAYFSLKDPEVLGWWQTMRQAYASATLALLLTPAITENSPFTQIKQINPLTTRGNRRRLPLRHALGINAEEDRPLILVTLGGIPTRNLPVDVLAQEKCFHWLLDLPLLPCHSGHLHRIAPLLSSWSFSDLAASVDGVVSKPGYGMAIAAATQQIPFLYLRRGTFPDEPPICDWLDQVGRCMMLKADDFYAGHWYEPLTELLNRPIPPAPPANGAEQGTEIIVKRFFAKEVGNI